MADCNTCLTPRNPKDCFSCNETWANCCCPQENYAICEDDCQRTTLKGVATCDASQLSQARCTLIVEGEQLEQSDCEYTVADLIMEAELKSHKSTPCEKINERFLAFYNAAVRKLNMNVTALLPRKQAVVTTCGDCSFYAPPNMAKIVAVSSDLDKCNNGCKKRRYEYVSFDSFTASNIVSKFTYADGKILIKKPESCGCKEVIPDFLMVDYVGRIPRAKSVEDCINYDERIIDTLVNLIVMDGLGVKYNNTFAVNRALDSYNEMLQNNHSHDATNVEATTISFLSTGTRLGG